MRLATCFVVAGLVLATLGGGSAAQAAGVTQGASAIPELAKTLPAASFGGENAVIAQARYHYRHHYRGHRYGWHHRHHYRGHRYGWHHRHHFRGRHYGWHRGHHYGWRHHHHYQGWNRGYHRVHYRRWG
jgi:hypothetical protein